MANEKRKKTRVHFETIVKISTETSNITATANSKDISIKGLFILTDQKIPINTPCDVEILLTGSSSRLSLKAKGRISRHDPAGLGIVLEAIDADSYFHLHNVLVYNAEDPDAMEKEMIPFRTHGDQEFDSID